MTCICPLIFTFMAYSPPYLSVYDIPFATYNFQKSIYKYIYIYIYIYMTYRKIPFYLWLIDVGLHTFIFLFMTYKGTTLLGPLSRLKSEFRYYVLPPLGTNYFIAPLLHNQPQIKGNS